MKKLFFFFLFLLICVPQIFAENSSLNFKNDFTNFKKLVKEIMIRRTNAVAIANRLKCKIKSEKPLSGKDLDTLNNGRVKYLELRKELLGIAFKYENSRAIFSRQEMQIKGTALALAASLILYDNYLLMISIFENDEQLRKFLNQRDKGYKIKENQLAQVTLSYNSIRNRARVRKAMEFYERAKKRCDFSKDDDVLFLDSIIKNSFSYGLTRHHSPLFVLKNKLKFMQAITADVLRKLTKEEMDLLSKFFGNSVGLIETRKGKLYRRADVFNYLTNQLRAGDILLEKTPFRLTDKFIPGHWGHAAIWVGTEHELKKLGAWKNNIVAKYQPQIKNGHCIVEALREGVCLNTLNHFLNIDDIAVIRPNITTNQLRERIILSLRQVGKDYDFNFDVETTDKIVCSELIYTVYLNIDWQTEKMLGRFTISPDNVAKKTFDKNSKLKLITFYHDGNLVTNEPLKLMRKLMMSK